MMSYKQLPDAALVNSYISGNEKCLAELIYRYQDLVFGFVYKKVKHQELAEDLFQDIFIKVINSLKMDKYKEEGKFSNWILRVARNHMMDYFRDKSRIKTYSGNDEFDVLDIIVSEDSFKPEQSDKKLERKKLRRFIFSLPKEMREVVVMRTYFDMSFIEIANYQQVGINTALGRMHNALKHLKRDFNHTDELKRYRELSVQ